MPYTPITNLQARVLPAAGLYYTGAVAASIEGGPWSENHEGEPTIGFRVTYTAGAAGGYPVMRVVWTVFDDSGSEVTMLDTITTLDSGAFGVCNTDEATNHLLALTDGSATACDVLYVVPRDAIKAKVEIAEAGNTGTPGTVTVAQFGRL